MHNAVHCLYFGVLLFAYVFCVLPLHDSGIPIEYNMAFYLNIALLTASLLLENVVPCGVAKRLLEWLLYYEIVAPIALLYTLALHTHVKPWYIACFFFAYLCLPGLYLAKITFDNLCSFLSDSSDVSDMHENETIVCSAAKSADAGNTEYALT